MDTFAVNDDITCVDVTDAEMEAVRIEQERVENDLALQRLETHVQRRVEHAVTVALSEKCDWFRDRVLDFHQGCPDGKTEFLRHCDLPVPSKTVKYELTVEMDYDTDMYNLLQSMISYIVEDDDYNVHDVRSSDYRTVEHGFEN